MGGKGSRGLPDRLRARPVDHDPTVIRQSCQFLPRACQSQGFGAPQAPQAFPKHLPSSSPARPGSGPLPICCKTPASDCRDLGDQREGVLRSFMAMNRLSTSLTVFGTACPTFQCFVPGSQDPRMPGSQDPSTLPWLPGGSQRARLRQAHARRARYKYKYPVSKTCLR